MSRHLPKHLPASPSQRALYCAGVQFDDLIFESNSQRGAREIRRFAARMSKQTEIGLELREETCSAAFSTRKATPPLETCFGGGGAGTLGSARSIEASTAISSRDHRSRETSLSVPPHSRIRTLRVAFSAGISGKRQKADVLFAREEAVSLRANADWLLRRAPDDRLKRARATRRALRQCAEAC